ncbi:MAG: hypothetical protein J6B25_00755 [Clostridia bacterium]|nr:hypothetical protein [Clostridia bacterium]
MKMCEDCLNYEYNEDTGECECIVDMDMDDTERYIGGSVKSCPYFMLNDEYAIVRKQN